MDRARELLEELTEALNEMRDVEAARNNGEYEDERAWKQARDGARAAYIDIRDQVSKFLAQVPA